MERERESLCVWLWICTFKFNTDYFKCRTIRFWCRTVNRIIPLFARNASITPLNLWLKEGVKVPASISLLFFLILFVSPFTLCVSLLFSLSLFVSFSFFYPPRYARFIRVETQEFVCFLFPPSSLWSATEGRYAVCVVIGKSVQEENFQDISGL